MSDNIKRIAGVIVFIAFVIFVQLYIGWAELLRPWRNFPLADLSIALLVTFFTYVTRALRIFDYFRKELRGHFMYCLKVTLQHGLLNNLLPARTGELSFPVLMARYLELPARQTVPALLWFRIIDIHTLVLIGIVTVASQYTTWPLVFAAALFWLPVPWLLYISSHKLKISHFKPGVVPGWRGFLNKIIGSLPPDGERFYRAWVWTAVNWAIKLSVFAWVLMQFVTTSYSVSLMGVIGGDLTSVLPVHGVAGAGTYEAGIVAFTVPYGLDSRLALTAAVNLHLFVLGSTIIGGLASLLIAQGGRRGELSS